MQISLGFSPCPNDTFIFHGLASQALQLPDHSIDIQLHDVETLNQMAFDQCLDVTKLSFYAWLKVKHHYRLLDSGGALGYGCGPVLIAPAPIQRSKIVDCSVALPGQWTTAHLLFQMWAPEAGRRFFVPYDRIFESIENGEADCGVIIHESRFTFEQAGFKKVVDLGAWWEKQTGLPIPLGCIAAHKRLPEKIIHQMEALIRDSIQTARENPEAALPYIRSYAREMTVDVLNSHIETFVNEFSLTMGTSGRAAVKTLAERAVQAGFVAAP